MCHDGLIMHLGEPWLSPCENHRDISSSHQRSPSGLDSCRMTILKGVQNSSAGDFYAAKISAQHFLLLTEKQCGR